MLYIQKQIQFWETDSPLPDSYKVGTTEEEYNDGAYLLLDSEQEQFHADHPEASPLECWNKQLDQANVLQQAKNTKMNEVYSVDYRHYFIDEKDVYLYDRLMLKDRCSRKDSIEIDDVTYPSALLVEALNEMDDYDEQCNQVTNALITAIDAAETAEAVEAIEVTGYPEVVHTTAETLQAKADDRTRRSPEVQAVTFIRAMVNSVSLPANKALDMQVLFPVWGEEGAEFGKQVEVGFRLQYKPEGKTDYTLYEVIQPHALQADWKPSELMALYKVVTVEHAGTLDDPIPYMQGMAFEKGKYYEQYGVIYLCILTTLTGYPNDLAELNTIVQPI